jgi:hypothetical protein
MLKFKADAAVTAMCCFLNSLFSIYHLRHFSGVIPRTSVYKRKEKRRKGIEHEEKGRKGRMEGKEIRGH